MNNSGSNSGGVATLFKWLLFIVLAIVALKVLFVVAGFAMSILFFILFVLGPILLVGWLIVKGLRYLTRDLPDQPI